MSFIYTHRIFMFLFFTFFFLNMGISDVFATEFPNDPFEKKTTHFLTPPPLSLPLRKKSYPSPISDFLIQERLIAEWDESRRLDESTPQEKQTKIDQLTRMMSQKDGLFRKDNTQQLIQQNMLKGVKDAFLLIIQHYRNARYFTRTNAVRDLEKYGLITSEEMADLYFSIASDIEETTQFRFIAAKNLENQRLVDKPMNAYNSIINDEGADLSFKMLAACHSIEMADYFERKDRKIFQNKYESYLQKGKDLLHTTAYSNEHSLLAISALEFLSRNKMLEREKIILRYMDILEEEELYIGSRIKAAENLLKNPNSSFVDQGRIKTALTNMLVGLSSYGPYKPDIEKVLERIFQHAASSEEGKENLEEEKENLLQDDKL